MLENQTLLVSVLSNLGARRGGMYARCAREIGPCSVHMNMKGEEEAKLMENIRDACLAYPCQEDVESSCDFS